MTDSYRIDKLGIDNYETWSYKMKFLLITKKLWSAIEPDPAESDRETRSSSKEVSDKSKEALGLIGLHVEDYLTRDVAEADTAVALWEKFKQSFQARNTSRLLLLRQQLTSLRKGHKEAVVVYLARAKDLMQNLKDAGSAVTEAEVVLSVLAGLPQSYATAVEVLQLSDDISFQKTLPKLLQVEQRVGQQKELETLNVPVNGAMNKNARKCHFCGKPGHLQAHCFKKKDQDRRKKEQAKYTVAF